jgi:hypothetical protein
MPPAWKEYVWRTEYEIPIQDKNCLNFLSGLGKRDWEVTPKCEAFREARRVCISTAHQNLSVYMPAAPDVKARKTISGASA